MAILSALSVAWAEAGVAPRITQAVDATKLVALPHSTHPLLKGAKDLGAVSDSLSAGRVILSLQRSDEQKAQLDLLLRNLHTKSHESYHKWLTPEQFGESYGPSDADVAQVTAWLRAQGLTVEPVSPGKQMIAFTGTVGQISSALHTAVHAYQVQGQTYHALASAPRIPQALTPVVGAITGVTDIKPKSQAHRLGQCAYDPRTHTGKALWTPTVATDFYLLAPSDFATQYDVNPVYKAGIDGTGQVIGVVGETNIDLSIVDNYRTLFGLSKNTPQVIIDGSDPEWNSADVEAYLDVETSGAVAPGATIKFYTSGSYGFNGGGGLIFSIYRAICDNEASVISVSYGASELDSPETNQLLYSLWEQAAAQGQTVVVASGDSGSMMEGYKSVSCYASTPWNVAVGGTDFYLADYATGGESLANYWNTTNTSSYGSLQKTIPEQPWNDSMYGFNSTYHDPVSYQQQAQVGGGGGASAYAQYTLDDNYNIISNAGWPKPAWQTGKGVPADGVRDLPDLALFAADGANGVLWPVTAYASDGTATDPVSGQVYITGVGGTSAAAPAFAGIMALVNQKYGRQGQANYVLYPLATQFPSTFNAIDLGSNNVPCFGVDAYGCSLNPDGSGNDSYQDYSAHTGFDLASGWGSVDTAAMLNNWSKITFTTSTTTLTATPTQVVHGKPIIVGTAVTGATGTPSGAVTLLSDSPLPAQASQTVMTLGSEGTSSATLNYLPGGTYNIWGQYGGDAVFAGSKSAPLAVTITPEDSVMNFTPQYMDSHLNLQTLTTSTPQVAYGTYFVFDVMPLGATAGLTGGAATGTVTYLDGTSQLGTFALSTQGTGEYRSDGFFAVGSHTITPVYSGDASYNPCKGTPVSFTVVPAASDPQIVADQGTDSNGNYAVGQDITCTTFITSTQYQGGSPATGTVTYQLGSNTPVVVPIVGHYWMDFFLASIPVATAAVTFKNLPAGTQTLTAVYSGDGNYTGSTAKSVTITAAPSTKLLATASLVMVSPSDPSTITDGTSIVLKATVTGPAGSTTAPTGTIDFAAMDLYNVTYPQPTLVPGTGATSTATLTITPDRYLAWGTNPISVAYPGDANYTAAQSTPLYITYSDTDFSIAPVAPDLAIKSGSSGSTVVNVSATGMVTGAAIGFTGNVTLTVDAPKDLSVVLSSYTVALNNNVVPVTMTVNTLTAQSTTTSGLTHPTNGNPLGGIGSGIVLLCAFLAVRPLRRRFRKPTLVFTSVSFLLTAVACHKSSDPAPQVATPQYVQAAPGTYTVTITAKAANGLTHNTIVNVVVS